MVKAGRPREGDTVMIVGLEVSPSRITLHDLDVAMDRLAAGVELRQLIVLDERTPL